MSSHLHQLHKELPELRISAAKVMPWDGDGREDESYRTPTSKESKIPVTMTCPPAPRKAKRVSNCKRKLFMDEYQFFEVGNNNKEEEMDTFFMSTFSERTCRCT
ncbi:hypothetical protein RIF29_18409 [Crotalaria pallida]|uniref:Uncharacterized protein n=1 Tax=Crotalaria pallida TaxID=3830 RepID=A0AAN9FQR8_CROPI